MIVYVLTLIAAYLVTGLLFGMFVASRWCQRGLLGDKALPSRAERAAIIQCSIIVWPMALVWLIVSACAEALDQ